MESSILTFLKRALRDIDNHHRASASALTVTEVEELRNIFALLLLGSFAGLPSPPSFLAVELLPFMREELELLHKKAGDAGDMFNEMFGSLGGC
ncbi:MAG: hypothetical protein CSA26_06455 [Desulfobacterales bacterium]|nr:MAG: hypothetical protein CSA26_06455 [Desulfobacterales bacterium]